jgi:hypothetical protein
MFREVIVDLVVFLREYDLGVRKQQNNIYVMLGASAIFVIDFQKSQWSDCVYLNLGIKLNWKKGNKLPSSSKCDLRMRYSTSGKLLSDSDQCFAIEGERFQGELNKLVKQTLLPRFIESNRANSIAVFSGMGFWPTAAGAELLGIKTEKF